MPFSSEKRRSFKVTVNSSADEVAMTPEQIKQSIDESKQPPKTVQENLDYLQKKFQKSGQTMKVSEIAPELELTDTPKTTKVIENHPNNKRVVQPSVTIELDDETNSKSFQARIEENVGYERTANDLRCVPPSNCLFYDYNDFFIRPFIMQDFFKIYQGNTQKRDDIIVDTVDGTVSIDVWDLTAKDFRYLMYWQRLNSYTRNPYDLNWTSFYGNRNKITISKSTLKIKELQATREEYQQWLARGFKMPTMRDLNEYDLLEKDLDALDKFKWIRAKYLKGASVREKLDRADQISPDEFFIDVAEFVKLFEDYGVTEYAEATDAKFEGKAALATLDEYLRQNKTVVEIGNVNDAELPVLLDRIIKIEDEIKRINTKISNLGEATPMRETVTFSINVTDFFPLLFT